MTEEKRSFNWGSFILGILFILAALLSFKDVTGNLLAIVIVYAIFAIIKGCYEIFLRNKLKELTGVKMYFPIIMGVIDLIVGIYLLFHLNIGITILPYVFAIWFLLDSIFSLFTLDLARAVSNGFFWFSLIVDILGIIVGFMLLFNPISSVLTLSFLVGFYFMMFGILEIVYSFR